MRNAEIAVIQTPSRARQAAAAIRRADGVGAGNRHATGGTRFVELCGGRARHHAARARTEDRDDHSPAERPAQRSVFESLPPQRHGHRDAREGLHDNRQLP